MANYNISAFNKSAKKHGLEIQIELGKAKGNVIAFYCQGYLFDHCANMLKDDVEHIMATIACEGVQEAYKQHTYNRNSSAKQKINEGHGRSYREQSRNRHEQSMTYAKTDYQFFGWTLKDVLDRMIEDTENNYTVYYGGNINSLDIFTKRFMAFHTEDARDKQVAERKAKQLICNLFENQTLFDINGFVYTKSHIEQTIKRWAKANDYVIGQEQIDNCIVKFINYAKNKQAQLV